MKGLHPISTDSLIEIGRALNGADVTYVVVGGIAVIKHGVARTTTDLDLAIQLEPSNVERALSALEEIGYQPNVPVKITDFADPSMRQSWIEEKNMVVFQLINDRTRCTPIDVFVAEPFDVAVERAAAIEVDMGDGVTYPIIRLETLLRMKKEAARGKDLEDIKSLELLGKYGPLQD